ncbi:hypothetical protein K388_04993 [Streptomyces sp. KhCrAH-43]|uniref:hypothetical protein n=1 Tax=unclassified Streptomyces TaxID=2593676 RepID=UPI00036F7B72|nr:MULTISPECIES: hypothetical protein [unclassified Streptomyces]MYS36293.1 hypothetical protein [Streptomyces sp. SID4920]MYX70922.1 hypothetical protein [Streptomyces sp. SID8373]RAJ56073.1 hypothetical protein K388_04993 [Streptomyces sp. KhCrAH-43]
MSYPAAPNRRRKTWIASLISTIVTPPLALFAFGISVFGAMACDACSAAETRHFAATFNPGSIVFRCGLVLAFVMMFASWVFTRSRPAATILLAVAAPATVFLSWALFMSVVDWP